MKTILKKSRQLTLFLGKTAISRIPFALHLTGVCPNMLGVSVEYPEVDVIMANIFVVLVLVPRGLVTDDLLRPDAIYHHIWW